MMKGKTELLELARHARDNAYAPYSGVSVGAALLAESGKIYTGANVENASYPCGICAERSAISTAVSCGERKFRAIAISGAEAGKSCDAPFYPCGICRQVMAEFVGEDFTVYVDGAAEKDTFSMKELLPYTFKLD